MYVTGITMPLAISFHPKKQLQTRPYSRCLLYGAAFPNKNPNLLKTLAFHEINRYISLEHQPVNIL